MSAVGRRLLCVLSAATLLFGGAGQVTAAAGTPAAPAAVAGPAAQLTPNPTAQAPAAPDAATQKCLDGLLGQTASTASTAKPFRGMTLTEATAYCQHQAAIATAKKRATVESRLAAERHAFPTKLSAARVRVASAMGLSGLSGRGKPTPVPAVSGVTISGTVSGSGSGGISGAYVEIDSTTTTDWYYDYADTNGVYSIPVATNDTYIVRFEDPSGGFVPGYYDSAVVPSHYGLRHQDATNVAVTTSSVSGINVTLPVAAHITGKITNAATDGLPDVQVEACIVGMYSQDVLANKTTATVKPATIVAPTDFASPVCFWAWTIADGTYTVTVAQNQPYTLDFWDSHDTYVSGYYYDPAPGNWSADSNATTQIDVVTSDVTGINVTLPPVKHISGTVSGSGSGGLPDITVMACSTTSQACFYDYGSGVAGAYSITLAPDDSYKVAFFDNTGSFLGGYYNSAAPNHYVMTSDDATAVAVADSDVTGIDVTLPVAYHISGTVRNTLNAGLPNIEIEACLVSPDVVRTQRPQASSFAAPAVVSLPCYWSATDANGLYEVAVPPNQSYVVSYNDYEHVYAYGYYDSGVTGHFTPDLSAATPIPVGTSDVTNIDVTLPKNPRITGRVTNSGGTGLGNTDVQACSNTSGCFWTTTLANGSYSVGVAVNGTYTLWIRDLNGMYVAGYYSSSASGHFSLAYSGASGIVVTTHDVTGINVTPPAAVHIRGTVSDGGASGIADIDVVACSTTIGECYWGRSAANGSYSAPVPRNGSYRLAVSDYTGTYVDGYYNSTAPAHFTPNWASATILQVTTADVTGKNMTLPTAKHISGTISNATPSVLSNILVTACSTIMDYCFGDWTSYDGTYDLPVMPDDTFNVRAEDMAENYASGYYSASEPGHFTADFNSATLLDMTSGDRSGIDMTLPGAVHISGTVTNSNGYGVFTLVTACIKATNWCWSTMAGNGGTYAAAVMPNSAYILEFQDVYLFYQVGYYDSVVPSTHFTSVAGSATSVTVVNSDVADIDIVLPLRPGGTYYTVTPYRVMDSRTPKGVPGKFHSRTRQTLLVADGASGVPADATAVTGNLTVVSQTRAGFVTVAPTLSSGVQPATSTINFPAGDVRANGVTVPLAASGHLDFMYWTSSAADTVQILFDVTGFFRAGTTYNAVDGSTYHAVTPYRVMDSRTPKGVLDKFHSQVKQTLLVATAASGVPTNATAVTGNLTVVSQTRAGFVTVAPTLTSGLQPETSTINFPGGDVRANNVTVPLAAGGNADFIYWTGNAADTVQILFDVTGYFVQNLTGATYHAIAPARVMDSRSNLGAARYHSRVHQTMVLSEVVVPTAATAVTGNVTVVGQTRGGFATVAPSLTDYAQPLTSTINFPAGDVRANGATVPLEVGSRFDCIYWSSSTADTTHLLFDVTGYFG